MDYNSAIMVLYKGGRTMKIGKKKSKTSQSLYVVIPQDQAKLIDINEGDDVCVVANERKKEIVIKKIK